MANLKTCSVYTGVLLWARAREVGNRWTVGQQEPFKDVVQWEIEAGNTIQDQLMEGESSGSAMGNAEEMDADDTPLMVRQCRLHGAE